MSKLKVVIVGGIAAGASAAAKAARTQPEAEIILLEREEYVSFGACGLPYWLGGRFESESNMYARSVEKTRAAGIDLRTRHEVLSVDYEAKQLRVKNLETDEEYCQAYDRLMIATGASPVVPPIDGVESPLIFSLTKPYIVRELREKIQEPRNILVVGGGFIGVEAASELAESGHKVTLVEAGSQLLANSYDPEMAEVLLEGLKDVGVKVLVNTAIRSFETLQGQLKVQADESLGCFDLAIMSVGFRPNTGVFREGLEHLENGALVVDAYGETSREDVYAAGDAVALPHRLLGHAWVPLATGANKLGRLVGENIVVSRDQRNPYCGSLGSSQILAGHCEGTSIGLTEGAAAKANIPVSTVVVDTVNHTSYWPRREALKVKLVYRQSDQVLVGGQIVGKDGAALRGEALAVAIHAGLTPQELGFVDLPYAPPFASTWPALNVAANVAKK